MKFKNTLKSRASIKKMKFYEFPELTDDDLQEGKIRDYENMYFCFRKGCVFGIYFDKDKDKLIVTMFHSWDKFTEEK